MKQKAAFISILSVLAISVGCFADPLPNINTINPTGNTLSALNTPPTASSSFNGSATSPAGGMNGTLGSANAGLGLPAVSSPGSTLSGSAVTGGSSPIISPMGDIGPVAGTYAIGPPQITPEQQAGISGSPNTSLGLVNTPQAMLPAFGADGDYFVGQGGVVGSAKSPSPFAIDSGY
jgi:hypothetical protein